MKCRGCGNDTKDVKVPEVGWMHWACEIERLNARLHEGKWFDLSLHASAPEGMKCADCQMDGEPCPQCYSAWWRKRHPNTHPVIVSDKHKED